MNYNFFFNSAKEKIINSSITRLALGENDLSAAIVTQRRIRNYVKL
jgi:hypothetical protein